MWNYRVVKTTDEVTKEEYLEIKEVYYDAVGTPMGYCDSDVSGESLQEIRSTLELMMSALDKPMLNFDKK
jgi:hypothetical protein